MGLTRPAQLDVSHDLSHFNCGEDAIDDWLRRRARRNHDLGASKIYVVCEDLKAVAFYTLSASGVVRGRVRSRLSRNMPDPIPVTLLGQLGVDRRYQGQGIAASLVKDALIRSLTVSGAVGVAAVYVDALTRDLIPFYERLGFDSISASEPTAMMIRMKDVRAILGSPS